MSDREIKIVIAAFLAFCTVAGGVMIYTVINDQPPNASAASTTESKIEEKEKIETPIAVAVDTTEPITKASKEVVKDQVPEQQTPEPTQVPPHSKAIEYVNAIMDQLQISSEDRAAAGNVISADGDAWDAATEPQRTAAALRISASLNPNESMLFIASYAAILKNDLVKVRETDRKSPTSELAAVLSTIGKDEYAARVAKLIESQQSATKPAQRNTIGVQELKRSSIGDSIRRFDYRISNNTATELKDIEVEIVCTTKDGKYLGSTKMRVRSLAPAESIIEKAMVEADVNAHALTNVSIVGDHKGKLEIEFLP
jgi:hypothetical protein